jgi:hypothetical protein
MKLWAVEGYLNDNRTTLLNLCLFKRTALARRERFRRYQEILERVFKLKEGFWEARRDLMEVCPEYEGVYAVGLTRVEVEIW